MLQTAFKSRQTQMKPSSQPGGLAGSAAYGYPWNSVWRWGAERCNLMQFEPNNLWPGDDRSNWFKSFSRPSFDRQLITSVGQHRAHTALNRTTGQCWAIRILSNVSQDVGKTKETDSDSEAGRIKACLNWTRKMASFRSANRGVRLRRFSQRSSGQAITCVPLKAH